MTTPGISLLPTLPFISPINTILLPLPIFIIHAFTSFQNFLTSLPFPHLSFIGAETHAYFTIPTFPTVHTALDPFHPCAFMPCHIIVNIRSAHPSFPLPLFFSSTPLLPSPPIFHSHSPSYVQSITPQPFIWVSCAPIRSNLPPLKLSSINF